MVKSKYYARSNQTPNPTSTSPTGTGSFHQKTETTTANNDGFGKLVSCIHSLHPCQCLFSATTHNRYREDQRRIHNFPGFALDDTDAHLDRIDLPVICADQPPPK